MIKKIRQAMTMEDGLYYTLVQCNLGRQFMPTEDRLYYNLDCMYPIKELDNQCLEKIGRTASQQLDRRFVPTEDGLYLFLK